MYEVLNDLLLCVIIRDIEAPVTLDLRIRELCARAVATDDPSALQPIMQELRSALSEHNEDLKLILADYPFLLEDLSKRAA